MPTLTDVTTFAKQRLTKHGFLAPVLLIAGTKQTIIRPFLHADEQTKLRLLEALGYTLAVENTIGELVQVFLVCEGWSNQNPNIRPANDPERMEAVFVYQYNARQERTNCALCEMVRDRQGTLTELKTIKAPGDNDGEVFSPPIAALVRGFQRGRGIRTKQAA